MEKISKKTQGIIVSVEPKFDGDTKDYGGIKYIFTYRITLENTLEVPVQLLKRRWNIFDSIGSRHTVEGEGVVGMQPIIMPGEKFDYSSWCPLDSNIGSMDGIFHMMNLELNEGFDIAIPKFNLVADWINN
jgi:ApaG protein